MICAARDNNRSQITEQDRKSDGRCIKATERRYVVLFHDTKPHVVIGIVTVLYHCQSSELYIPRRSRVVMGSQRVADGNIALDGESHDCQN